MRSLLALSLCGCSLFGIVKAPDPHCTRSVALPVADLLAVAAIVAVGVVAVKAGTNCSPEGICLADGYGIGMMTAIGGGVPFAVSSVYGFVNVDKCTTLVPPPGSAR